MTFPFSTSPDSSTPEPPGWPGWPGTPAPEIPYPLPPGRPERRRDEPLLVPMVEMPDGDVRERLLRRRTVMFNGPLDMNASTRLCAELMMLDGEGPAPVELLITSDGGPVHELLPILDVIELMRAPLNTSALGAVHGTAAILVAYGTGVRQVGPHASMSLRCARPGPVEGSAEEVSRRAAESQTELERIASALSQRCALTAEDALRELEDGGVLDGEAAIRLGLVDRIKGRGPAAS